MQNKNGKQQRTVEHAKTYNNLQNKRVSDVRLTADHGSTEFNINIT